MDVEDLYHNINAKPLVAEKADAKDFEFKEGKIKFENLQFKYYSFDESVLKRKAKPATVKDEAMTQATE